MTDTAYTLANGLRVVHHHDPASSMVAVNVLYNTGARDEARTHTGLAHLFEHLMFAGSEHVAHFDRVLEDAGGSSNAFTSSDYTDFYDILPAANFETALYLESDRMRSLSFSDAALATQRSVVIEEFKQQCLNRPYGDLGHALRRLLYAPQHPYSWPVIGLEPGHVAQTTLDDIRRWFFAHYAPNNAVLAIAGGVSPDTARPLVEKWFSHIPARDIAPRELPPPGFPTADIHHVMLGPVPAPLVVLAYPMEPYGTEAYRAADCITDLLAAGTSSRLYRRLLAEGDGSITDAEASIIGSEGPGFLMLQARPAVATADALDAAADALTEQLQLLAKDGDISRHELDRCLNRFESTYAFGNLSPVARAQNMALACMRGEDPADTVTLQRALTPAVIADTAATLLATPRVRIDYLPGEFRV